MTSSASLYFPLLFWAFALVTVGSALAILFVRDIVRCAFLLMLSFSGVAGLFLLLGAEFLAFTQILVYVGGILILILFGVMLTHRDPMLAEESGPTHLVIPGTICGGIFLVGLLYVVVKVNWTPEGDRLWPGDEERLTLVSTTEEGDLEDPHFIDGWLTEDSDGNLSVANAAGATIAIFTATEEDGDPSWGTEKVTQVRTQRLKEGGEGILDGPALSNRRIYGRLKGSSKELVLHDRHGSGGVARFEKTDVSLTPKAADSLFDEEAWAESISLNDDGLVQLSLYVNVADRQEVLDIRLDTEAEAAKKYRAAKGTQVGIEGRTANEKVVSRSPALDETPVPIGKALMTDFLLPFEIASVLLLAALVGATMVARRGGVEGV